MIKFKHDDTATWSIASIDCRAFRDWEKGWISARTAAEIIRINNGLSELSVDEFLLTALELGYRGGDESDG